MLIPNTQTVFKLNLLQVKSLCDEHLADFNLDMSIFTREGCHHYLVDVTDEIIEFDLWKTEEFGLLDNPERCSVTEALSDYLSIVCWRKGIPKGDYLITVFW